MPAAKYSPSWSGQKRLDWLPGVARGVAEASERASLAPGRGGGSATLGLVPSRMTGARVGLRGGVGVWGVPADTGDARQVLVAPLGRSWRAEVEAASHEQREVARDRARELHVVASIDGDERASRLPLVPKRQPMARRSRRRCPTIPILLLGEGIRPLQRGERQPDWAVREQMPLSSAPLVVLDALGACDALGLVIVHVLAGVARLPLEPSRRRPDGRAGRRRGRVDRARPDASPAVLALASTHTLGVPGRGRG